MNRIVFVLAITIASCAIFGDQAAPKTCDQSWCVPPYTCDHGGCFPPGAYSLHGPRDSGAD